MEKEERNGEKFCGCLWNVPKRQVGCKNLFCVQAYVDIECAWN